MFAVGRRDAASMVLGPQHPLARALALRALLARDLLAVGALAVPLVLAHAGGLVGLAFPGVCGAAVVALASAALAADTRVRERALELIADGDADTALAAVARRRERLMGEEHRRMLASSFAALRALGRRDIGEVDEELRELERRLVAPGASPCGVALAERLLSARGSVLYGREPERLREELRRIAMRL
jgi:hypothetical protein